MFVLLFEFFDVSTFSSLFLSSLFSGCSGLVSATFGTPLDVIKTRMMNQRYNNGVGELYKSTIECFIKTVRYYWYALTVISVNHICDPFWETVPKVRKISIGKWLKVGNNSIFLTNI